METTTTDKLSSVKDWLLRNNQGKGLTDIDPDLDLIEKRILDSLQFVEFLLFLEEVSGREIVMSSISVDAFRTLNKINDNFLKKKSE